MRGCARPWRRDRQSTDSFGSSASTAAIVCRSSAWIDGRARRMPATRWTPRLVALALGVGLIITDVQDVIATALGAEAGVELSTPIT